MYIQLFTKISVGQNKRKVVDVCHIQLAMAAGSDVEGASMT